MDKFLYVGLGGAIGAMLRYAISLLPIKSQFPFLTLVTNILGAILIGFIVALSVKYTRISPPVVLLLKTGICGGFTTFSTFSLESLNLFQDHHPFLAMLYVSASVVFCILGVWAGGQIIQS